MNGIGQSLAALGRSVGPMTGAPLFAWTADHGIHQVECDCVIVDLHFHCIQVKAGQ